MKDISNQISFQVYQNQEIPFQFEQGLQIFFGLQGTSRFLCGSAEYELLPAGLLVINPFELYRLDCPDGAAVIGLRVSNSLLQLSGWKDTMHCSCYVHSDGEGQDAYHRLRVLYAAIFQDYFQNSSARQAEVAGAVMQLTGLLQSQFSVENTSHSLRDTTMQRLQRIMDFIHEHWNEPLSLSEIAASEYLSASYLSRFFQKHLHLSFSQYLTELRLRHAAQILAQRTTSITQVAYDCGFHTPSAFIEAFKHQYGQTPGQFRQAQQMVRSQQAAGLPETDLRSDMSVLLAFAPQKQSEEIPSRTIPIAIHCKLHRPLRRAGNILNIGYARDGLLAPVQEQIRRAQKEIGFTFMRFHGIFDEDMRIYREDEQGTPQFDFTYVNLLFDFILSQGLTPYIELSFMPPALAREPNRIFDRVSIISGCRDLEKWALLVRTTLQYFIDRYGRDEVLRWRFTTISKSYVLLGLVNPEDFDALYYATWRAIKSVDPLLRVGGPGGFAEQVTAKNGLPAFLDLAEAQGCMPDFLAFQCHPHEHIAQDPLFMNFTINQQSAPSVLSQDDDFVAHTLDALDRLLKQRGLSFPEIYVEEINSTLWQRDLSSETCYKAVWIAKNFCENLGRAGLGYWLLTDFMEERATLESVFHGGYGLFTYNGIPKAGYQAMRFLSTLGDEQVAAGPGWMMTCSKGDYQLLTYNYCNYSNLYRYRYKRLDKPEDAYSVFDPGEIHRLQFQFSGLADGTYRVERRSITRSSGSSFDKWLEIGAPRYLRPNELRYLIETSQPSYQVSEVHAENGLRLEVTLRPLETQLVILHKLDMQI